MNKVWKIAFPLIGAAVGTAAMAGLAAYAIAPEKADEEKKDPFMGRNIAHRGLHRKDKSVPENSLAAFKAAADRGYGVEFDVHLTADNELVVFHDDTLNRMCGVEGKIHDMTYDELQELKLAGTEEGIPLLNEVLEIIGGRVPIILEIKHGERSKLICQKIYKELKSYNGAVCIESFDPFIVGWWRRNAPEILRGQLSCQLKQLKKSTGFLNAFLVSNLLTNFIARPNFIAYGLCDKKPMLVRISEKMGAMKVAWTSRDWLNEEGNDTVIFEFYRPRRKYK